MSTISALKQIVAVAGLLLIVPIAVQMLTGTITPIDAAFRAGVLFLGVMVARRMANLTPRPQLVVEED